MYKPGRGCPIIICCPYCIKIQLKFNNTINNGQKPPKANEYDKPEVHLDGNTAVPLVHPVD